MSTLFVDEIAGIASADTVAIPGHVIQVVSEVITTRSTTSSSSYVATDITASITPTSASSKILVCFVGGANNDSTSRYIRYTIYRGAVDIAPDTGEGLQYFRPHSARVESPIVINYLDSPSTTSATTYTLYHKSVAGGSIETPGRPGLAQTLTLMEIAG